MLKDNLVYISQEDDLDLDLEDSLEGIVEQALMIFDKFNAIKHNLTTYVFSNRKFLKESELINYYNKNKLSVNKFFKNRDLPNVKVYVPDLLKTNYPDFTKDVLKYYNQIDIDKNLDNVIKDFKNINKDLSNDEFTNIKSLNGFKAVNKVDRSNIEKILNKHFSRDTKTDQQQDSRKVLKSVKDTKYVFDESMKFNNYYKASIPINSKVKEIEKEINKSIDVIKKSKRLRFKHNMFKSFVIDLADYSRMLGQFVEAYGLVMEFMQRIEHNLVLVLKKVISEKRKFFK